MEIKQAVRFLAALAQETRLSIFRLLVEAGPTGRAAGDIAVSLGVSPANLSFHLKELAHAELVRARQDGRYVFYSAHFPNMNQLLGFLTDKCCVQDGGCSPCKTDKPRKSTKGVPS